MMISNFFLLNLFIGVVISSFNREKDLIQRGNVNLTDKQKAWVNTHLIVMRAKPKPKLRPPVNCLGGLCFHLMTHKWFRGAQAIVVFAYVILLTLGWGGRTETQRWNILLAFDACTCLFFLEFIIKVLGQGKHYFLKSWNITDFTVLILQLLSVYLCHTISNQNGYLWAVVCVCRVSFTIRTIKYAKVFRRIFNTLILSIPQILNIGSFLVLILYVYTVAGVSLFSRVKLNNVLKENLNFQTFPKGAFTLFVLASTDSWSDII